MKKITQETLEYLNIVFDEIKKTTKNFIQFVRDAWLLLLLLILGFSVAIWLAKPAPPEHVYLATTAPNGIFSSIDMEYVAFFRRHGITLELVASKGSQQNFEFLKNKQKRVQAAFVQSGIIPSGESAGFVSLGSIRYEPLWFFYRGEDTPGAEQSIGVLLKGKIAIGYQGSGTFVHTRRILELNGYQTTASNMLSLSYDEASAALKLGDIDGMFIVSSIDSSHTQTLLHDPALRLISFTRAHAYARQMDYISVLEAPMGGFDLSRNFPQRDTQLLATTTSLIVNADLHPAIQMLFLQAVSAIHGRGDYFAKVKEFPAYRDATVPESAVSARYHKSGPSFLSNYLPFWMAEFIDRLAVMFLPLAAFSYPIIRRLPNYRLKRQRKTLANSYKDLALLRNEIINHYTHEAHTDYLQRLNKLEQDVLASQMPSTLLDYRFELLMHIDFVRDKLDKCSVSPS